MAVIEVKNISKTFKVKIKNWYIIYRRGYIPFRPPGGLGRKMKNTLAKYLQLYILEDL